MTAISTHTTKSRRMTTPCASIGDSFRRLENLKDGRLPRGRIRKD
jgi:hypothetical protein